MKTDGGNGRWAAVILLGCLIAMGCWMVLARQSARPWAPLRYTAADFEGIRISSTDWNWKPVAVNNEDPTAPNLVAFAGTPWNNGAAATVLVRLAHGYNMPMCMRIKGYRVESLRDEQDAAGGRNQIWRLVSDLNEATLWITRMVRAADLADSGSDIRNLAFPRVGVPDDPRWAPPGMLSREFLRHPWASMRRFIQVRWNGARTDWRTFLKWRQPAWVSDEEMTVVVTGLTRVTPDEEAGEIARLQAAQKEFLDALRAQWRATHPADAAPKGAR